MSQGKLLAATAAIGAVLTAAAAQAQPAAAAKAAGTIAIPEARLHSYDDGPVLREADKLGPGDGIWVTARLAGYAIKSDEDKDKRYIHLTYRFEAVDPDGVPLIEPKTEKIETDLAREDKNWQPKIRFNFVLPPLPDSGVHRVILSVTDEFGKTAVKRELPFRVQGYEVEKSDKLTARNIRFQRREEDTAPLNPAVYRPGDTVWLRFDMTGYKLGERNAFDVAYGLEVLRVSDQKSLYAEPNAAREKDATLYRKRYLQGALSLNLTKDLARGEYAIILRLRDDLAGQSYESKHPFMVE